VPDTGLVASKLGKEAAMSDLTALPPETFFRLAVERGGLDLEEAIRGLGPAAAAALRHIAAAPSPESSASDAPPPALRSADAPEREVTRSLFHSAPIRDVGAARDARRRHCPACGLAVLASHRFCRRCGRDLAEPAPAITLDEMVAAEQITVEQADELREKLLGWQQDYAAGTRYSVFGGPS
jgi:hypothetical protein